MEATSSARPGWSCDACGWSNDGRETCERCGVARRWQERPALDLPPRPRWRELPSTYLALLYGGLTVAGTAVALQPAWRAALGWAPAFLWAEVALALVGCVGALNHAVWSRLLHELTLRLPDRAPTGQQFEAVATLVPYDTLGHVRVALSFHDRYFQAHGHGRDRRVERRSTRLARHVHHRGGSLLGRRAHTFTSAFEAPFPLNPHTDVTVELTASLLSALQWLWPPARRVARNLREHGGYVVRLTVRRGPWRRTIERKILIYHLGDRLRVG